jgi:hypothetical protein
MGNRLPNIVFFMSLAVAAVSLAPAQVPLTVVGGNTASRIVPTDMAILEAGEDRADLPCSVLENKPVLGFDLRYHVGYEVSIPLRELAGGENLLTVLFRVTPLSPEGDTVYMTQRIRVPPIEENAKGDAYLQGGFDVGTGKYKIDWLIRDRSERVCSSFWEVEAVLPDRDKEIALSLAEGTIQAMEPEQFTEEPPVARNSSEPPLNLKVLVNFAPQNAHSSTLQPLDTSALVSILRNISRDPRVGKFTVVAFNLHEQRVIYRQDNTEKIDFPALGEALKTVDMGTVDLQRLSQRNGDTEFLTELIRTEAVTNETPDALVFAGPKAMLDDKIPSNSLQEIKELGYPVFYMNYNLRPNAVPWNDAIGKAVKFLKGQEYTISRPRDLWYAVTEMVSRIAKLKQGRRSGTSSSE